MPEATIKYDLALPEEEAAFMRAAKSLDMALALTGVFEILRKKLKYAEDPRDDYETLERLRDRLHELMEEHSLDLDALVQ